MKRITFLQSLCRLIPHYGADNVVYFDETGFQQHVTRTHGWAPRGQKIYGDVRGNNRKTTNLIMAQRRKEWLAPMLFEGACNHLVVNAWLEQALIPLLTKPSIIIMDNAAFHKKKEIAALLEKYGHVLLPLPPYSPDFNPIENTFGTIKKRRQFAPPNTPLDHFFKLSDY
jgi:putative transposase